MRWLVLAVLVVAGGIGLRYGRSAGPVAVACDAALKVSLVAPWTYRRVELREWSRAITVDEFFRQNPAVSVNVERLQSSSNNKPTRHAVTISYEASSTFGPPFRQFAACFYDSIDGDPTRVTVASVVMGPTAISTLLADMKAYERQRATEGR